MKPTRLLCCDCTLEFDNFSCYKEHAGTKEHQQQVAETFQTVPHNGQVHLPRFTLDCVSDPRPYPVIGLQLVSLCISTEWSGPSFYLCHACHEKCQSDIIVSHLKSTEHYFSVFACLNPERLCFGWFHPPAMVPGLKVKAEEEEEQQGPGVLRVIDMPKKVFENIKTMPYFQTMKELPCSDKLKEMCRVHQPERMTVQEYLRNPSRTHPLLGLSFLVQYRCVASSKPCGYLCLLCKKRVRELQSIAHIISFDHVYWYLDRVHPLTLRMKSSYRYGGNFSILILDLARQAQEISTSGAVQEIELDSEDFAEVDTGSYANALDLLKVVHQEQNQSDLLPHITPGPRLVYSKGVTQSHTAVLDPVQDSEKSSAPASTGPRTALSHGRISCQVCSPGACYFSMLDYKKHVRGVKHKRRVECLFQAELHRASAVPVPQIVVYEHIVNPHKKDPIIGLHLVTACIDTQTAKPPIYLCHICQDKCTSKVIMAHLISSDHCFFALAFMDPERLHFGWIPSQNMLSILEPQVQAVEKEQGMGMLQLLDMPQKWFNHMQVTPYIPAMRELCQEEELKERLRVRRWTKLEQYHSNPSRKYPLIGMNFLVGYKRTDSNKFGGYLCLLCKKSVREPLVIAHIIGFDHVFNYLDLAHPSSLGSKSLYKHYDAHYGAMMLDLASQAEKIDSSGRVQVIKVDPAIYEEVDSSQFVNALKKLQAVSGEKIQTCIPLLVTVGQRLVPKTQKPALSSESKCVRQSSNPGRHLAQSSEPEEPSQSFQKLWDYLKNKERQEPVIGLDAVLECTSDDLPPHYLCEACSEKMTMDLIIDHLISPRHRYQYLKLQHLLSSSEEKTGLNAGSLKESAFTVEKERGFGEAQVLELDAEQYKEIVSSSINVALNRLQTIQKQQSDLQPLVTSEQKLVKGQKVQSHAASPAPKQASESKAIRKNVNTQEPTDEPSLNVKRTGKSLFVGQPDETPVSKLLDNYLKSKQRKVPVIGLSSLIEYHGDNKPNFLECKTCYKTVPINGVIGHLIGPTHRYKYIKSKHPDLLEGWSENPSMTNNIQKLHTIAELVEKKEGWGQFKVLKLEDSSAEEMGPTSNNKLATEKSKVTAQVRDRKSTETQREPSAQKRAAPMPPEESPVQKPPAPMPSEVQRMSDLLTYFHKGKNWKNLPLIGLREVMECSAVNWGVFYICKVCNVMISKKRIIHHVAGLWHRAAYIKALYPSWLKKGARLNKQQSHILKLARIVQDKEGIGDVQLVELDVELYKRLHSMSADNALKHLQMVLEEQSQNKDQTEPEEDTMGVQRSPSSIHPEPTPKQPPCLLNPHNVTVKQEKLESWEHSEEPVQDPQHPEPEQVAASKNSALPEQPVLLSKDTELKQVAVKQEPVEIPAVPQCPETVTVIEDAVKSSGLSEKPLQTSNHEELQWAPFCEKVYQEMTPRVPPQDPRRAMPNRVEIPVGESHFSKFLLSLVTHKPEPLVGLGAVVECRSFMQATFYLCLTCAEKVSKNHICNHIISNCHQYRYICSQYPDLVPDWKNNPTGVAWWVQDHERVWDVQVMKLDLNMYNQVASVPFGVALDVLQGTRREQNQSCFRPLVTPGHRPIIVNKWTLSPWEVPKTPQQNPGRTESPRASTEEAISHQETALGPEQVQTVLRPEQDPKLTELDGRSPCYSVCISEKRHQGPGLPQEPSQDPKEVERQSVDTVAETAEHGGASDEPEREPQNPSRARAAEAEAVLAQASRWEPWLNLKGTETDKAPVEKACRPTLDLQTYMEDPCRTQPLVGLGALIECRGEKQVSFYLCMACRILLKTRFIEHIIGPKHRNSYLLKRRPDLFREGSTPQDSAKKSSYLLEVAKEVERGEWGGVREIQKVSLDSATYTKVKSMPFDKALTLVQTFYKQQNHSDLQTHVTPTQRPVMVKQEKVESEECSEKSIQDLQITGSDICKLKGQSQDAPQESVQHPKSSGTEGSPGVENVINAATASGQEHQSGSGVKSALIGLQRVIKCVNVDGWPPPFYLCQACSTKLTGDQQTIIKHLTSGQHLYFYIISHHPKRLDKEKKAGSLTCGMTNLVQFVAKKLEEEEGSGSFQVINMSKEVHERLKQKNYEYCIKMLQGSNGVEKGQSCSKPGKGNPAQHTAPRLPDQTPQNSGPRSERNGPSTCRPPVVSDGHRLAEMRTQERTSGSQRTNHLESSRVLSTHHPSASTGCPSLERGPSQPLTLSHLERVSQRASEPRASTPGPAHNPCDTTSQPVFPSFTKLPPAKRASLHHPSQATASSGTNDRRSFANEGGDQGQQISTVTHLHSPVAVRGLTAVSAGDRRHEVRDEAPWNYENRQFTSGLLQAKRSRGAHDPGEGAPDRHLSDGAPRPSGTQIHGAKGGHCGSNIFISPSKTLYEQEFLSSCWDTRELTHSPAMPKGVQDMDMNSWSECLKNDWHSKEGTSRIVIRSSSAGAPQTMRRTTTACPRNTSAGRVPQSMSVLGKRFKQSSSTQCNTTNNITNSRPSDFDPPPVKIPGLDYTDIQESPAERLLTCWKTAMGGEVSPASGNRKTE
ncbi:uncharacterized protein LOC118234697 isoform X1 [Anguilla anguilla]|uniref:uncharacterized protein LOC118234697 isoform X1 n=2 Tax=Anguilla anguilla TaxID=7936 RepID=UPI0015B28CFD|nr:uncharacterized protein LOC118234697 isoform X1 [Anguilla anguilla]XP_035287319.1 uncharacterized protein LOC118234697 isoform X1 [Anguilla anguilla]